MSLRQNSARISLLLPHSCHIARPSHHWFDHPSDIRWRVQVMRADPSDRAVYGVSLCPFACWDAVSNTVRDINVCCECCVLSGRRLCNRPITPPGESYRIWSRKVKMRKPGPIEPWKKNAAFHYAVFLRSLTFSVLRPNEPPVWWKLGFLLTCICLRAGCLLVKFPPTVDVITRMRNT